MQPRTESSSQPCQLKYTLSMQPRTESSSQPCQLEYTLSIMPVSPSTRDAAVQTLLAPPVCEDSSQTREPERAPPTGGKSCTIIVPVSLLVRTMDMQLRDSNIHAYGNGQYNLIE